MDLKKGEKIIGVGALGGSGTRAVAQILIDSGVYLGDDLNSANDNLVFTRLFKNPAWYENAGHDDVQKRMLMFAKYMRGERLSTTELKEFVHAARSNPFLSRGLRFYSSLVPRIFQTKDRKSPQVWGWKEPNTQIFVNQVADVFPGIKYVHVLRNGLEMAFSRNLQQLTNWGYIYDIHLDGTESEAELAVKQLDFWIRSSENVINKGKKLFERNFYLLDHTAFCTEPVREVQKLLDFLDLDVSERVRERLVKIPIIPKSFHRHKNFDLSIFSENQIRSVRKLGYSV